MLSGGHKTSLRSRPQKNRKKEKKRELNTTDDEVARKRWILLDRPTSSHWLVESYYSSQIIL